jgi:hypothetical protein
MLDNKLCLNSDPMCIIEYFLWRKKAEYVISMHYGRSCVCYEVLQNKHFEYIFFMEKESRVCHFDALWSLMFMV